MRFQGLDVKLKESAASVLPIVAMVSFLCFGFIPVTADIMLSFALGALLLIFGLGLFSYGAENSMTRIGTGIGAKLTASRNIRKILAVSFLLGVVITVAEPDLTVLSDNVPHINSVVLILTVAAGVGLFLLLSMVRILYGIPLKWFLIAAYLLVFLLAAISDRDYLSVAFDSGGVTTGPMTSPFIMALGIGVASIRSDRKAEEDSFGLVALCSIGPILAVLILSFFYRGESGEIASGAIRSYTTTVEIGREYLSSLPSYMKEVALSLAPIFVFFLVFQIVSLRLHRIPLMNILRGILCTYIGLVIFLTGVGIGFSPLGLRLGKAVASLPETFLIGLAALMGWFIVAAEPAVHILTKQVEEISAGTVSAKAMQTALSIAIALAAGISMLRATQGIPILCFLVPGYVFSLILSLIVPPIFTAISFDAGGVASGPMTTAFLLPFAMGACEAAGGNLMTDAFGTVAMVAMFPLITVQLMGVVFLLRSRKQTPATQTSYADTEIIELWESGSGNLQEAI